MINNDLKNNLLNEVKQRNLRENVQFFRLIKSHTKLLESYNSSKIELSDAKLKIQKLQQENLDLIKSSSPIGANSITHEKIHELESKLSKSKDEMIDLQKKLVDQAQQVIALNKQLKEKTDELSIKEAKIIETDNKYKNLKMQNKELENKITNYEEASKLWNDEKVESDVQYNCLSQKYEKLKEDYQHILAVSLKFREEQIDRINRQNEFESERMKQKLKEELELASQTHTEQINLSSQATIVNPVHRLLSGILNTNSSSSEINYIDDRATFPKTTQLPSKAVYKFECHEGEVNAIKFHKTGKYFATGGGDRKIKIWEYKDGTCESLGTLIGSNASIASVDIDNENNLIAGASFDFSCRLWSLYDSRLRMSNGDIQPTHTLTGHTNKVSTGKFFSVMKIVTGSYDRTLKIWDLMQKACIKTLFAGSSCNDVVTLDSQCVISGHFDKKIRFWDVRADPTQSEILLQGKITSLDISPNRNYLLANIKDINALKLIDIRMNQVVETFCCDEYKTSCDWSKAVFSPDIDHQYVCAGSTDGTIYFWNTSTTKLEKTIKEHSSAVITLAWHPLGNYFVSCDNKKKAIISI